MNKPELKTVYIPVNEYKDYTVSYKMEEGACDYVNKQQLITFTPEEYNNHIKDIIKETLDNAADNAIAEPFFMEGEIAYMSDRSPVNKESITNTLENTFNKLKYE